MRFIDLKAVCFDNATRGSLYHYCIWAIKADYSGKSDPADFYNVGGSTPAGTGGDDCLIAIDDWNAATTVRFPAEILMHELGHQLNLQHGGTNEVQFSPAYNSIMSYSWMQRSTRNSSTADAWRLRNPICTRFYYASPSGIELNGAVPATVNSLTGYSEGMGRTWFEGRLNEQVGVCGLPVDWNGDGIISEDVAKDLNGDGDLVDHYHDFADWRALVYTGARFNGYLKLPGEP